MIDLTGKVFGKLTVESPTTKDRNGQWRWLCLCECGGNKEALAGNLKRGKTISCGCSGKRYKKRPDGEAAFTELFGRYKTQARNRGLSFELSEEHFRELTQLLCNYCGAPPSNKVSTAKGTGYYFYNGIDRKDNNIGYTVDNAVPCCLVCNRAKNNMPFEDFVAWLNNLLEFNKEIIKE